VVGAEVLKMHLVLMEDPVVAEAEVVDLEIVQVDQVILLLYLPLKVKMVELMLDNLLPLKAAVVVEQELLVDPAVDLIQHLVDLQEMVDLVELV
tara:strand:+ start:259 stop:540 length:282 start_codon:yes stop_codon:yes gene_type:complete